MQVLFNVVQYILDLGASVMMPIIILILGLLLGQSFGKSFRAGLTIGVGFVGINLIVGFMMNAVGGPAQAFAKALHLNLDVLDVGWPIGAAIAFANAKVAMPMIPIVLLVNVLLLAINFTKTMDVDIWNYWHFIFAASVAATAFNSIFAGIVVGVIVAIIVFKLADWTAPVLEFHFGLPGVSLPHTETVGMAPLMYALEKIEDRIPGFNKWRIDPEGIQQKFGLFGEPLVMGLVLGMMIGVIGNLETFASDFGAALKATLTLGVQMAAVLVLLPRMVAILMEGLIPISEGAREFISKRFPGKEVYIGLDAAIVIGHPAGMTVALLMVPISLLMAGILPYNRMLPFADLAVLPFVVIWAVAVSRGNIIRGLINSIITMLGVFFVATDLAQLLTDTAKAIHFNIPAGAGLISGIDIGAHVVPWIVLRVIQPGNPSFIGAVVALVLYAGLWYWVRNDIKKQYASELAEKQAMMMSAD